MTGSGMIRCLKGAAIALLIVALPIVWWFSPVREWAQSLTEWLERLGLLGVVLFGIVYVCAVVALAPSWPLSVMAGLVHGFWGIPIVAVAATVGASAAFFIGRYTLRHWAGELMRDRPVLKAIDRALEDSGLKIVLLVRLSPLVPFNLQNYFFGATRIGFLPYVVATAFGIIPGTTVYVYLGLLGKTMASSGSVDGFRMSLLAGGLVASIVALLMITKKTKEILNKVSYDGTQYRARPPNNTNHVAR